MVAVDSVGPGATGTTGTGTSLNWAHSCSGTNRLLVVSVCVTSSTVTTIGVNASVTYAGVSMTSAGKVYSNNSDAGFVEMFYLVAPEPGTNTVVLTTSQSMTLIGGSISFMGVNQSTPVAGITTAYGSGTTASVTVSSSVHDMVVTGMCAGSSISSSAQTMRWVRNVDTLSGAGNGAQSTLPGSGSGAMTYTVGSDAWGIVGMAVKAAPVTYPSLVATYTSDFSNAVVTKSVIVTTQPGDTLVVYGGGESESPTLSTPTGNGISFTLQQSIVTANYCSAYLWTAVDASGGNNWTLSVTSSGSEIWGFGCTVFRGVLGIGSTGKINGSGVPLLNLPTSGKNSAIVVYCGDYNANNGANRLWRPVSGVAPSANNSLESVYFFGNNTYTAYAALYNNVGVSDLKPVGLVTNATMAYSLVAAEITMPQASSNANVMWLPHSTTPYLRATATNSVNTVNSIDVVIPSSVKAGDLMVLIVAQSAYTTPLFNAITGWTKQGEQRAGGAAHVMAIYTRTAQAGDAGTTVSATSVSVENMTVQLRAYGNAHPDIPLDAAVSFGTVDPASLTGSAPAITVSTAQSLLITAYSLPTTSNVQLSGPNWTSNAGFDNELVSCTTSGANNAALASYDKQSVGTGSQGPFSATTTDSRRWATATLAIRPGTPLFTDDFSGPQFSSKWGVTSGSLRGGRVHLTTTAAYTQSLVSAATFNLTNRSVTVQAPVVPSAASGEMSLEMRLDSVNKVAIGKGGNVMVLRYMVANVSNDTYVTFSSFDHLWWRLNLIGTTLNWQTSPDGITWTTLRSVTSGYPSLTNANISLYCGHYTPGDPDESVEFDNLTLL